MTFRDRGDAGRQLAKALATYAGQRPIVLALPRGGVPVAAEIAAALGAQLDLLIVRKIGVPLQPELAMGAVVEAEPPLVVRNEEVIREAGISGAAFAAVEVREIAEARRRRDRYLIGRPHPDLKGRTVIVVDDGIATGSTMRAALAAVKKARPERIVLAVPVAAPEVVEVLRADADEIVCLEQHKAFGAIGYYYDDFAQVSDEEVIATLAAFAPGRPGA
jgi:predicted phosphoribosyltransferase